MPGNTPLTGLHHVALVSREIERATEFYRTILGLADLGTGLAPFAVPGVIERLAGVPARFFGAGLGRPGIAVSILDRPREPQGAPGIGGTHHFAFAVADRSILLQWKRRLLDAGYPVNGILDRHYFQSLYTRDPDGTIVELATVGPGWTIDEPADSLGESHRPPPPEMLNTNRDRARVAAENWPDPVPGVTSQMRIRGLHHVTAIGADIEQIHSFIGGQLWMRRVKRTSNFDDAGSFHWYWGVNEGRPGTLVTYFERKPTRELPVRMGSGQVAHFALAVPGEALEPLAESLTGGRTRVSAAGEFGSGSLRFHAFATHDPEGQPVVIASAVQG